MKTNYSALLLGILLHLFLMTACSDDKDPQPVNDEEEITTLRMTFTPQSGGNAVTLEWKDLDGAGGNAPIITAGTLQANTSYSASLELLNELENESITAEIQEEDDEHQFFFTYGNLFTAFNYADTDGNNLPVGLQTSWTTGAPTSGTLNVILRHQPNKSASGVAQGDATNAGGETDIEVGFQLTIQ